MGSCMGPRRNGAAFRVWGVRVLGLRALGF